MSVILESTMVTSIRPLRDGDSSPAEKLRLDANECIGADSLSATGIDRSPASSFRYPDSGRLERLIADRAEIAPDRIVATAGADDAIDRIFGACLDSGSSVLIADPTFTMLRTFAENRRARVRTMPWISGPFPTASFVEASRGCDLVALVSPNNPTGLPIPVESLMAFRSAAPDPVLLIDLAYIEFGCDATGSDPREIVEALRWMPKTVMVRTLSKAWGLAGLRVGWTESAPDLATRIRAAGGPFPIASASIEIGCAVLSGVDSDRQVADRVRRVSANRSEIVRIIEETGLDAGDSIGNFLLVSDPDRSGRGEWLADGLAGLDIMIRRFEDRILADRVRITIPVGGKETARLARGIATVLDPTAILFDLDGVLADVTDSYRIAIRDTAGEFGVEVTNADIERLKSGGDANDDWEVTRRLLAESGLDVAIEDVVERFQRLYLGTAGRTGLRERERSLVDADRLAAAVGGRSIGVVTGRPRAEARWFLERSGLADLVEVLVAREDAPLKPDPAGILKALAVSGSADAWFFGDTVDDMTAARRVSAGRVLPIGVDASPASSSHRPLIDAGAARVITAGASMIDLIEGTLS